MTDGFKHAPFSSTHSLPGRDPRRAPARDGATIRLPALLAQLVEHSLAVDQNRDHLWMRFAVRADAGRHADLDPLAVEDGSEFEFAAERLDVAL